MRKEMLRLFFFLALFVAAGDVYAQFTENPPEPMAATTDDARKGDCGAGDGGTVGGISPPVGLCLPINDYLVPLLLLGIVFGSFSLWRAEQVSRL